MITKNEILVKVKEIVSRYEVSNELSKELTENDNLSEVHISDLSRVQIAMELERVFDVEFDINMISRLNTINDLVSFIESAKKLG